MVVLAASICTRGGKTVLSRQFREVARSRIEGLLAAFPKLADSGTQHTTVEQDNVRYVYQPLDELYMVLITNRQSNILQDIDSLHLFAQIVTNICDNLDEKDILYNAYELLSAFDEVVNMGFRENLNLGQIKTFLEMESHEERIQEIISRNKELEATEERKRKAKQLELQRKEVARNNRNAMPRTPSYPTYTPPAPRISSQSTYDSYEAERNKPSKPTSIKKGMQLGKKNKTEDMFEQVKNELGPEAEIPMPVAAGLSQPKTDDNTARDSVSATKGEVHVVIGETISARFNKEGALKNLSIKGDLQLRVSDSTLTKLRLEIDPKSAYNAQFKTHPNVDKAQFLDKARIQMKDPSKGFPVNTPVGVLRWSGSTTASDDSYSPPLTFNVWVNKASDGPFSFTIEYEMTGSGAINDVVVTIPFSGNEPTVSSTDEIYEVSSDCIEWTIGNIREHNNTGTFEFEAEADDEAEFFPMTARFSNELPMVPVDIHDVRLLGIEQQISFTKDVRSVAESYVIEQD